MSTNAPCSHCGLPVPPGRLGTGDEPSFCCDGCCAVYQVIHQCGLEQYYAYRQQSAAAAVPAKVTDKPYTDFDSGAFQTVYCRPARCPPGGAQLLGVDLYLENVHCAACVWLLEKLPSLVPGVAEATLDFSRGVLHVTWDPEMVALSEVARRLDALGYPAHPYRGSSAMEAQRREQRALLMRIGVAGAVAGNVMLMAFALYGGVFAGMEHEYWAFFRWGSLIVTLPAVFWSGQVFFRGAWAAVKNRTPHMDLPVSIGILAGFAWGTIGTIQGRGEIYFDTVTTLIFLLLVGRWLQQRHQNAAREAAELLHTLTPSSARVVTENGISEVPAESVVAESLVEVRSGDTVPVDGVIESGDTELDTSVLTGESRPMTAGPGDGVHAGSTNLTARVTVRCKTSGADTRVGRLMQSVEEAARRRAAIVRLADRVAGHFVVGALVLATVTLGIWLFVDPAVAVDHTVALLVVTCPCALGMATPLAVSAALGAAAKRGLLIKGGDALEQMAKPGLVVFDKTGTLTEGRLALVDFAVDDDLARDAARTLSSRIATLEAASAHPIARAFVDYLTRNELDRAAHVTVANRVTNMTHTLGGGVRATVDGHALSVGSPSYVSAKLRSPAPSWAAARLENYLRRGLTPVVVAQDGVLCAVAAFDDPLRADAADSLVALRQMGYELGVLSGDHPEVVARVAGALCERTGDPQLFVLALGSQAPEDKLAFVEERKRSGPVFMVGDGVNDAAALSAASVGIAVHGGAEASLMAADVFATRAGVGRVVELARGARRALSTVRRGIAFSLVYNAVGVALAMSGVLSPWLAAVLMPLSSLTVVTNAYRSKSFVDPSESVPQSVESQTPAKLLAAQAGGSS